MSGLVQNFVRRIEKLNAYRATVPTPGTNHVDEIWQGTDIYPGELSINPSNGALYTTDGSAIIKLNSENYILSGLEVKKTTSGVNTLTVTTGSAVINGITYNFTSSGTDFTLPFNTTSNSQLHFIYGQSTVAGGGTAGYYNLGLGTSYVSGTVSEPGGLFSMVSGTASTPPLPVNSLLLGVVLLPPGSTGSVLAPVSVAKLGDYYPRFSKTPSEFLRSKPLYNQSYTPNSLYFPGQLLLNIGSGTFYAALRTFISDYSSLLTDIYIGNIYPVGGSGGGATGTIDTALNLGAGSQVYKQIISTEFQFRSLTAPGPITLDQGVNEISIGLSMSGFITGVTAIGNTAGISVFGGITGVNSSTLLLRSLMANSSNIILGLTGNTITIDAPSATGSIGIALGGTSFSVYAGLSGFNALTFRSLLAGTNIGLTQGATSISLYTTAEINDGINVGGGLGNIYAGKTGPLIRFRSFNGTGGIAVSTVGDNIVIDGSGITSGGGSSIGVAIGTIGASAISPFLGMSGSDLTFSSIIGGYGIVASLVGNDIFLDSTLTTGSQGSQGFQGLIGIPGSTGAGGADGVQGWQGDSGPQGFGGFAGPQGNDGSSGIDGTQGFQGMLGPTGNPGGPQGNQGLVGAGFQGRQGFIGITGSQGVTGAGFQGPQGIGGFQGFQGLIGITGSGNQGFQGFQGRQGFQGFQGRQGFQGAIGLVGASGASGSLWTSASGVPSSTGNANDQYLDISTGNVYQYSGSAWVLTGNIEGPQGPIGSGGGGSSLAIGATISGATANSLLFSDSFNNLQDSSLLSWNGSLLNIGNALNVDTAGSVIQFGDIALSKNKTNLILSDPGNAINLTGYRQVTMSSVGFTPSGGSPLNDLSVGGTYNGFSTASYKVTVESVNNITMSYSIITGSGFSVGDTITGLSTGTTALIAHLGSSTLDTANISGSGFSSETITNGSGTTATITGFLGPAPDTFKWTDSITTTHTVQMSLSDILLNNLVTIEFSNLTGHEILDFWAWSYTLTTGGMLALDGRNHTMIMGDVSGTHNSNYVKVDDENQRITMRGNIVYGSISQYSYGTNVTLIGNEGINDIVFTGGGATCTVLLPSATVVGQTYTISDLDAISGTFNITVDAGTGKTINGSIISQYYIIANNGATLTVKRLTNTAWKIQ